MRAKVLADFDDAAGRYGDAKARKSALCVAHDELQVIHAAPWSVASQWVANVSHGYVGMSTANARWLFQRSRVGDVVTIVHSTS